MRYNDFLFQAVNPANGRIKAGWDDIQSVNISSGRVGPKSYLVNTGMREVVKKLKSLGYDLRGINDSNKTIPYFTPMSKFTANSIIKKLKQSDPEYRPAGRGKTVVPKNMQPDVVFFSPNKQMSRRDDIEPTETSKKAVTGRSNYETSKNEIEQQVQKIMEYSFSNANKNSVLYPNMLWWSEPSRYSELWKKINERILLNWKNPIVHTQKGRISFIRNEISKVIQNGVAGRRTLTTMRKKGFDVNALFSRINPQTKSTWTPDEVKQALERSSSGELGQDYYNKRYQHFIDVDAHAKRPHKGGSEAGFRVASESNIKESGGWGVDLYADQDPAHRPQNFSMHKVKIKGDKTDKKYGKKKKKKKKIID